MSGPDPAEFPKIRAWIQSEAKKDLSEIKAFVDSQFADLTQAVVAIPSPKLNVPVDDDWSPIDALKHAVEWNWQVGEDVLHVSLTGERPGNPTPTFEPERDALLARQQESLDSVWAHVSAADPQSFLDLTWPHPFFGELNWREWYFFIGVHCFDHKGQIRGMSESPSA
ncbi:MAG: DinB family protein [Dehalococcoidia bacterium]